MALSSAIPRSRDMPSDGILKRISVFKDPVIDPDSVTASGGMWTIVAGLGLVLYAAFLVYQTTNQDVTITTEILPVGAGMTSPIRLHCMHAAGCVVQLAMGTNIDDQTNFIDLASGETREISPKVAHGALWIGFYAKTCGGGCDMISPGVFSFTSIGSQWEPATQQTTTQLPGRVLNPDGTVVEAVTSVGDLMDATTILLLTKTVDKVKNGPDSYAYATAGVSTTALLDKWYLYRAATSTGTFLFTKVGCNTIKAAQCPASTTGSNPVSGQGLNESLCPSSTRTPSSSPNVHRRPTPPRIHHTPSVGGMWSTITAAIGVLIAALGYFTPKRTPLSEPGNPYAKLEGGGKVVPEPQMGQMAQVGGMGQPIVVVLQTGGGAV
ncbi:hypothetical protein M427DRAFT_40128 [Gonapodya prolifera JEL478]|uniref:Uncharacterized protein n=1 Tax=Gonapodya prolifera (strain JEL478) TaxID=1344416 RepID=A0A139AZK6_GONPJ|nr:hypothetical protein M427DRAFT_40128 [Gonapodya prolifera JEL478]|eukprot:KXS22134.1 hypothetical protein M427DRAFT_40128 [Gonapodya prolifera JEL478]